jgi:hypothetical protein
MKYFLNEKIYNPNNLSLLIKSVFTNVNKYSEKSDKNEQIEKSILHIEYMYDELKGDYEL